MDVSNDHVVEENLPKLLVMKVRQLGALIFVLALAEPVADFAAVGVHEPAHLLDILEAFEARVLVIGRPHWDP